MIVCELLVRWRVVCIIAQYLENQKYSLAAVGSSSICEKYDDLKLLLWRIVQLKDRLSRNSG